MGRLVSHSESEWRTDPAEASWHRRARRNRQLARAVLAVSRARLTLAAHHGGGLHLPGSGDMGRPYVACLKCKEASSVYVGNGVTNCHRCGLAFPPPARREHPRSGDPPADGGRPLRLHSPGVLADRDILARLRALQLHEAAVWAGRLHSQHLHVPADGHLGAGHDEWPPLPRNLAGDRAKKGGEVIAASLDALVSSGKCDEFGEVLRNIKASVCTPAPVKHGAAVSGASQRVCIALRVKEAAVAKRKGATDEMAKLLHWMEELGKTCPELDAAVKAADYELHLARAENEKAVGSAIGHVHGADLAEGGSDPSVVISALQSEARELQGKLAELSSARGGASSVGVAGAPGSAPVLGAIVQGGGLRGRQMSSGRDDRPEEKVRKDRTRSGRRDQKDGDAVRVPDAGEAMQEGPDGGLPPDDHEAHIKGAQGLAEGAGVMPASAKSDQSGV